MSTRGRTRGRLEALAIAAAIGVGAVALPAAADAQPRPVKPTKVTVMTRNLYLGADLGPAIAAPTAGQAYTAVGNIYHNMHDLNFNARAKLLATEIEAQQPDLIGLQEVSIWRRDDVVDGSTTPATEVVYDYLELLTDELDRRGLDYTPAVIQQEADLEFPADTHGATTNDPPDGTPDFDARLTMRDVILVRDGVKVKGTFGTNFPPGATASVNTPAFGPVSVKRGFEYADVRIDRRNAKGTQFRFFNTHLESFSAYIRNQQAIQIAGSNELVEATTPVVLVGDLNSDPDDDSIQIQPPAPNTANSAAYDTLTGPSGGQLSDFGLPSGTNTCCFSEGIRDAVPMFDTRIDHVLGKGAVQGLSATLIGTDQANRSGTGLWPTDHGGVVAHLKIG